jgi:hypothetical protein
MRRMNAMSAVTVESGRFDIVPAVRTVLSRTGRPSGLGTAVDTATVTFEHPAPTQSTTADPAGAHGSLPR